MRARRESVLVRLLASGFEIPLASLEAGTSPCRGMIQDTIAQIEQRLRQGGAVDDAKRAELLHLLATLKAEVSGLSETHADQAQSIAGFTAVSAHEATREEKNPDLVRLSLKGLASSVEEFEASHPRLVEVVNRICTTLSNLGI